jgi:hypothetical protein
MVNSVVAFRAPVPDTIPELGESRGFSTNQVTRYILDEHWTKSEQLRAFCSATDKKEALTGRLTFDTFRAAQLVVGFAKDKGFDIPEHQLGKVASAISTWLSDHGISRKARLLEWQKSQATPAVAAE